MSERLPAFPLIANDPYFSYWLPADCPAEADPAHWAGRPFGMNLHLFVDGRDYRLLGRRGGTAAVTADITVSPTATVFYEDAGGIRARLTFRTPALPDKWDILSVPATYIELDLEATDGQAHDVTCRLFLPASACYADDAHIPELYADVFMRSGVKFAFVQQKQQNLLCHSGDHTTIDWGRLLLAGDGEAEAGERGTSLTMRCSVGSAPVHLTALAGYDDIASIDYFGVPCRAWHTRNGETVPDAMVRLLRERDAVTAACDELDDAVCRDAEEAGGADYRRIVCAAWRHTFAAHKLICTPSGEPALLSKENDSNGCIGTVDVSYPSTPLFLKYAPELVNALCRPVLEFASMPVWKYDFAPHDVGRYPHAIGQVYSAKARPGVNAGATGVPYPLHLYGPDDDVYGERHQMPVEESGNMLVMLRAAMYYGADDGLVREYRPLLEKWVRYLDVYGEDPGEQLCTDDFAGHLAHNVNLAAKALVGVKCYAQIMLALGDAETSAKWDDRAAEMARSFYDRVTAFGHTPLTFDGIGWSMKYNLAWDRVMGLGLLPEEFYDKETRSYLPRLNRYGLPLDSRSAYTKSDWECWSAAMAPDRSVRCSILAPVARFLSETRSRVAFSDWYYTDSGLYEAFIGRSVQGGVFMPMLAEMAKER